MKKLVFIIPYIGKLPKSFQLFLNSCGHNSTIDFLLFIDDRTEFIYPLNVKVHYTNFDTLRQMVQRLYDFPISLPRPYKFCDYRPAYGEIFSDWLNGYDFWGHCDLDLIWGDIRHFVTKEVLDSYDRIYTRGHCCLYRNTPAVNAWYRTLPSLGCQEWKACFMSEKSRCYDEWSEHVGGGISLIVHRNGIKCYDEIDMADLNRYVGYFEIPKRNMHHFALSYERGKLYAVKGDNKIELLCVHFQRRSLVLTKDSLGLLDYYINAPGVVEAFPKRHIVKEILFTIDRFIKRILRKLRIND